MANDEVTKAISTLKASQVRINLEHGSDGYSKTSIELSEIEFDIQSPCQELTVFVNASGVVKDIVFANDALSRLTSVEASNLILRTVNQAEQVAVTALQQYCTNVQPRAGK